MIMVRDHNGVAEGKIETETLWRMHIEWNRNVRWKFFCKRWSSFQPVSFLCLAFSITYLHYLSFIGSLSTYLEEKGIIKAQIDVVISLLCSCEVVQ